MQSQNPGASSQRLRATTHHYKNEVGFWRKFIFLLFGSRNVDAALASNQKLPLKTKQAFNLHLFTLLLSLTLFLSLLFHHLAQRQASPERASHHYKTGALVISQTIEIEKLPRTQLFFSKVTDLPNTADAPSTN